MTAPTNAAGETWLQLPAEMGGTRFGPFRSGVVQIGADNNQCQIVLPAHYGIAPVHVTVAIQPGGVYVVQPVQRGYGLFLAKPGGSMFPVGSAVQAGVGDTLVLGSPTGPRFTLSHQAVQPGASRTRNSGSGGSGLGGRLANELWRQQSARWMMRNPLFRELYQWRYRLRTGALTNPRVLAGVVVGVGALVVSFGSACIGALGLILKSLLG